MKFKSINDANGRIHVGDLMSYRLDIKSIFYCIVCKIDFISRNDYKFKQHNSVIRMSVVSKNGFHSIVLFDNNIHKLETIQCL